MIQIISGVKGKGKTKYLIQKANDTVKNANGNVVYLDKNNKHMYELSNKIRLINLSEFPLDTYDAFLGFICGLISQDHDLDKIYLDSFLKVAKLEDKDITGTLGQLDEIGKQFNVTFVISVSLDKEEIPEALHGKISVAL